MPIEIGKSYAVRIGLLSENRDRRGYVGVCTNVREGMLKDRYGNPSTATLCTLESDAGEVVTCIPGELEEVYTNADLEGEGRVLATFERGGVRIEVVTGTKGYEFRTAVNMRHYQLTRASFEEIRETVLATQSELLNEAMSFAEDHYRQNRA